MTHGLHKIFHIEQIGSLAYILALTSSGYASSCISFKPANEWDIAAGFLLLKESGCSFKILGSKDNTDGFIFNKKDVYYKKGFFGASKSMYEILKNKIN